jgi:hypothetical protein
MVLLFTFVFLGNDFVSILLILGKTALTLLVDEMLEGAGPEDVHDGVDPDQVLDRACHCPEEDGPENTICRVLAVGLHDKHHDAINQAVGLNAEEHNDYQLQVVKSLGLGVLSEGNFELIVRNVLLYHTLVDKET